MQLTDALATCTMLRAEETHLHTKQDKRRNCRRNRRGCERAGEKGRNGMGRDKTGKDHLDLIGPFAFAHRALHLLEPSESRRLHLLVHLFHYCVCLDGILFACHLHADDARDIVDGNCRHGASPAHSGKIRVQRGACSRGDVAQHAMLPRIFFVVHANAERTSFFILV